MRKSVFIKACIIILVFILAFAVKWVDDLLVLMSCKETVINQVYSPNEQYAAQFIDIGCNATVGFSEGVKLVDKNEPYAKFKKLYRVLLPGFYDAFYGESDIVFTVAERPPVKLKWENDTALKITYPNATRIYRQQKRWHNIYIIYGALAKKDMREGHSKIEK